MIANAEHAWLIEPPRTMWCLADEDDPGGPDPQLDQSRVPGSPTLQTVLVVEDNDDLREYLCLALDMAGFPVVGVRHGATALAYLQQYGPVGVIILDLMMPVMDGFTFRRKQRELPGLRDIPVVVVTARGIQDENVNRLEASGYLSKPVDAADLLRLTRLAFARRSDQT
jgi:CheY-like chemotaxis protein